MFIGNASSGSLCFQITGEFVYGFDGSGIGLVGDSYLQFSFWV